MKISILTELIEQEVSHNPAIKKKVMLRPGELPYLTNFSQARFTPGQVANAHSHDDMYEIFFVEAGEGIIKINQRSHTLLPGTCVTVEPGEVHEITNSGSTDLILTYFGLRTEVEVDINPPPHCY
jgi:quercetin dioxygenase-like cupin family protein